MHACCLCACVVCVCVCVCVREREGERERFFFYTQPTKTHLFSLFLSEAVRAWGVCGVGESTERARERELEGDDFSTVGFFQLRLAHFVHLFSRCNSFVLRASIITALPHLQLIYGSINQHCHHISCCILPLQWACMSTSVTVPGQVF